MRVSTLSKGKEGIKSGRPKCSAKPVLTIVTTT